MAKSANSKRRSSRQQNQNPPKAQRNPVFWGLRIMLLAGLLFLPYLALRKLCLVIDVNWIAGYLIVISLLILYLYGSDKRKAQQKEWRTPEQNLHFFELIGAWPMAFLAQRIFWHKISKTEYQITYWIIVMLHQYTSFDYLKDWHTSTQIFKTVKPLLQQIFEK